MFASQPGVLGLTSLGRQGTATNDMVELQLGKDERIVNTEMWSRQPSGMTTEVMAMRITTSLNRTWSTWEAGAASGWPSPRDGQYKYEMDLSNTAGRVWACGTSARLGYTRTLRKAFTTAIGFDWCYDVATVDCKPNKTWGKAPECDLDACPKIQGLGDNFLWTSCKA